MRTLGLGYRWRNAAILCALMMIACDDDNTVEPVPTTGVLEVSTSTSGEDPDADGYTLTVDAGAARSIGANATITFPDLSGGDHTAQLGGLADNCTVSGQNPRTITITPPDTVETTFAVQCAALSTEVIAFNSDRGVDGEFDIFVMNPDGSNPVNLTNHAARDLGPSISPDGSKIAFMSSRDDANFEIYVMNVDGTGVTRLTNNTASEGIFNGAWSPDGSQLVFQSDRDGNLEIYVMNADGSGVVRLTNDPALDLEPAWSPDGSKIAFQSTRDDEFGDIHVMSAVDGSGIVNLTLQSTVAGDWRPSWSPDGSRIAFSRSLTGDEFDIHVINADGSGLIVLASAGFDLGAVWSPDGSMIAFSSDRTGSQEIFVMSANGTGVTNLTNHPSLDGRPAWR